MDTPVTESGILVAVEGPDGLGKTTLCHEIVRAFRAIGTSCLDTAQPSQSRIGRMAKARLNTREFSPLVEAAIDAECFCADMIHHNAAVIQPGLAHGEIIICDRYDLSPLVYQSVQGLPLEYLRQKHDALVHLGLIKEPDLTIVLCGSAATSIRRLVARNQAADKFETQEVLTRVHSTYDALCASLVERRIVRLSAEEKPRTVLAAGVAAIEEFLRHIKRVGG